MRAVLGRELKVVQAAVGETPFLGENQRDIARGAKAENSHLPGLDLAGRASRDHLVRAKGNLRQEFQGARGLPGGRWKISAIGAHHLLGIDHDGIHQAAGDPHLLARQFAARDRALLRGPGAPRSLELGGAERGACILADGRRVPIAQDRAGVTRFWVALPLSAGRRRTLLVAAGMLAPEAFRRLRLWALWGKLPAVAGPQRTA